LCKYFIIFALIDEKAFFPIFSIRDGQGLLCKFLCFFGKFEKCVKSQKDKEANKDLSQILKLSLVQMLILDIFSNFELFFSSKKKLFKLCGN